MFMNYSGQGAIEYLLIIAAAILVVAIVILAVTGALGGGQVQTSQGVTSANSAFDSLKASNPNYILMSNHYYLKSGSMMENVVAFYDFEDSLENKFGMGQTATCASCTFEDGLFGSIVMTNAGRLEFDTPNELGFYDKLTISAWVKYGGGNAVLQTIAAADESFWLRINGIVPYPDSGWDVSETFSFWVYDDPANPHYNNWEPGLHSLFMPQGGQWYQVVATFDRDEGVNEVMKIYINGELKVKRDRGSYLANLRSDEKIYSNWLGGLEELVIFDRVLTEDEIKQIYENAIN